MTEAQEIAVVKLPKRPAIEEPLSDLSVRTVKVNLVFGNPHHALFSDASQSPHASGKHCNGPHLVCN
jgi:hypothetical protein